MPCGTTNFCDREGTLRKLTAACALLCALTLTTTAAAVDFGANDDTGRYSAGGGATFFAQMKAGGLSQNVMTVRWTPGSTGSRRQGLPRQRGAGGGRRRDQGGLRRLSVSTERDRGGHGRPGRLRRLGARARRRLSGGDDLHRRQRAESEHVLAPTGRRHQGAVGRRLRAVPRGRVRRAEVEVERDHRARRRLLAARRPRSASGRQELTGALPRLARLVVPRQRPHGAADGRLQLPPVSQPERLLGAVHVHLRLAERGRAELSRIKQALWDAFNGTPQATTVQGLKLSLDEVGWQVDTSGNPAYEGAENVRVTSEETQAAIYTELVRYVSCDPDVAQLNFFGYYDEPNRAGWQSALRRADGTERPANAAVAGAIAAGCTTGMRSWSPLAKPEGAAVEFGLFNAKAKGQKVVVRYTPTAGEDVTVKAGFVPASTPVAQIPGLLGDAGRVDAEPAASAHAERHRLRDPAGARGRALGRAEPVPLGRVHERRVRRSARRSRRRRRRSPPSPRRNRARSASADRRPAGGATRVAACSGITARSPSSSCRYCSRRRSSTTTASRSASRWWR